MENEIFKLRKEHVNFKKLLSLFDAQLDFAYMRNYGVAPIPPRTYAKLGQNTHNHVKI